MASSTPKHHSGVSRAAIRPARYEESTIARFKAIYEPLVRPGISILDVGSGAHPRIGAHKRDPDVHYVGLDISVGELQRAPEGSYHEMVETNVEDFVPALAERFDLILSWYTFEHIVHLDRAVDALHRYARPGGWFVGGLAGRNAVFALGNRLIPERIGVPLVTWLRGRAPEDVFTAHYDQCTDSGLRRVFADWAELQIVPLFRGAHYLDKVPIAQRAYLKYEDWAMNHEHDDLATYYIVAARKAAAT